MADQVISLRLVIANGSVIEASRENNSDIFYASLISMGSTGIITEVTVQADDIFNVTRYNGPSFGSVSNRVEDFDIFRKLVYNNVSKIIDEYDYIYASYSLFRESWNWQVYLKQTDENRVNKSCWNYTAEDWNKPFPCSDYYYKAISPFPTANYRSGLNHEAEFYVFRDDFYDAFLAAALWCMEVRTYNSEMWNVSQQVWMTNGTSSSYGDIKLATRWIATDHIWLSPGYVDESINTSDTNTHSIVQIGVYVDGESDLRVPDYIFDFWVTGVYKAMKQVLDGRYLRVHWGKASMVNHCDIKDEYPKMDDFKTLRNELDPNEMFVNALVRDKLGICDPQVCCCTYETCNTTEGLGYDFTLHNPDLINTPAPTLVPTPVPTPVPTDSGYGNGCYINVFVIVALQCFYMAIAWIA